MGALLGLIKLLAHFRKGQAFMLKTKLFKLVRRIFITFGNYLFFTLSFKTS